MDLNLDWSDLSILLFEQFLPVRNKSFFFRTDAIKSRERKRERFLVGRRILEEGAELDARLKGEPPGSPSKKGRRMKESGVQ